MFGIDNKILMTGGLGGVAGLTLGAAGGLFGGKRGGAPNIEGELAKIGALFDAQRAAAKAAVAEQARGQGVSARNSMAARGTLRSPVAEHVFGEIRRGEQDAYAQALGQIAGQEAGLRGNILSQLLGYQNDADNRSGAAKSALFSQGGGLLSSLLLAAVMKNPAPLLTNVASTVGTNSGGAAMDPRAFFRSDFGR